MFDSLPLAFQRAISEQTSDTTFNNILSESVSLRVTLGYIHVLGGLSVSCPLAGPVHIINA